MTTSFRSLYSCTIQQQVCTLFGDRRSSPISENKSQRRNNNMVMKEQSTKMNKTSFTPKPKQLPLVQEFRLEDQTPLRSFQDSAPGARQLVAASSPELRKVLKEKLETLQACNYKQDKDLAQVRKSLA